MNKTSIEWCRTYQADGSFVEGHSVNPIRFRPHGSERTTTMCQKVSPGCAHCYAEGIARRFWPKDATSPFPGYTAQGLTTGKFVLDEKMLDAVLRRQQPTRLFWGDMTDLFQESVPDNFLDRCFAVAALTPHITHIFLTKRAERMRKYLSQDRVLMVNRIVMAIGLHFPLGTESKLKPVIWPLPNVHLCVSVENQQQANERIPLLLETPAAVRGISAEPLLGLIDLNELPRPDIFHRSPYGWMNWLAGRLGWVIVGGESGGGARPMHPDWARSLRNQCTEAKIPFFFKQHGEWISLSDYDPFILGTDTKKYEHRFTWRAGKQNADELPISCYRVGNKTAGRLLDGCEWNEMPARTV